jgi:hypothetical protein
MNQLSATLLALGFVIFTLVSLLSVKPTWDSERLALSDDGPKVSEIGLRVNFQR